MVGKCKPCQIIEKSCCIPYDLKYSVNALATNDLCQDIASAPSEDFRVVTDVNDPNLYKVYYKNKKKNGEETICYIKKDKEYQDEYTAWSMLEMNYIYSNDGSVPIGRPSCASNHKVDSNGNLKSINVKSTLPAGFTSTGKEVTSITNLIPTDSMPSEFLDTKGNRYTDFGLIQVNTQFDNGAVSLLTQPYYIKNPINENINEILIFIMRVHYGLSIPMSSLSTSNSTASKISAD